MSINMEEFYSVLASRMKTSTIRETLKIIQRSNVISLAGGMPDPATFPAKEINKVTQQILTKNSACALQYSSTEGLTELRELILNWFSEDNKKVGLDNILITSGSQQGLDLVSKVLLNPGDIVIVELPSYLAALNAFRSYGGEMKGISMDDEGVQVDILEEILTQLKKEGKDVMLNALSKYFPSEAFWTKPEGGFFIFVTLPEYIDVDEMFPEAIEEGVAYVSGSAFFANGKGKNTMRLSFCYPKEEDIEEGIKRLGKVIKKKIKN